MEGFEDRGNVIKASCTRDQACSRIENSLETPCVRIRKAIKNAVAVIKAACDKGVN